MKLHHTSLAILACLAGTSNAITISGTVTDRNLQPLANADVKLVVNGATAKSTAQGKWSVASTSGIQALAQAPSLQWNGRTLEVDLVRPASVGIRVFDASGATLANLSGIPLQAGHSSIPLPVAVLPAAWIGFTCEGQTTTLSTLPGSRTPTTASPLASTRAMVQTDTLRLVWSGRTVVDIPVSWKDTSGIVIRFDTSNAVPWKTGVAYGNLYDRRDGQVYRTIKVYKQTWMAENLNYAVDSSWHFKGLDAARPGDTVNENLTKGVRYGRYYKWATVMKLHDSCNAKVCASLAPGDHPGLCPQGWHVPRAASMAALIANIEADSRVSKGRGGRAVRSTTGWKVNNGWDYFGFHALPGGYRAISGQFLSAGYDGFWLTGTEESGPYFTAGFTFGGETNYDFDFGGVQKDYAHPLRCMQNSQ
ncbi:MAG TPA: FISUMP domain-containing protein [Fibrobacteria bacterium]|nr:FISUMP domain-containing protein [Fibrobacteria bacterium]